MYVVGDVVAGNHELDDADRAAWPRALVDVNLRRRPLISAGDDYDQLVDKRYMRFGRRASDETEMTPAADKRYMRFGRRHFHPLMAFTKRYMRFGRR